MLRLSCVSLWCLQGFLPESADRFATDVIYPAFSPQMGVFFVCSTAYGVWKVRPCHIAFIIHNPPHVHMLCLMQELVLTAFNAADAVRDKVI